MPVSLSGVMVPSWNDERSSSYNVPVVGIRHGKLGFLATFSPEEMDESLPLLFSGQYRIRTA